MRYINRWLAVLLLSITIAAAWYFLPADFRSSKLLLEQAKRDLARRDHVAARKLGRTLIGRSGYRSDGYFVTAKSLSHQADATEAVQLFEQIPDGDPQYGLAARISAGELLLFRSHRLSAATECFQRALRIDPHNAQVHERFSYIYGIAGMTWRAVPHRMAMLCRNQFGPVHLMLLALGPNHEENAEAIRGYYAADSDDPLALCAMARLAIREDRDQAAVELLQRVVATHPELPEPQAWYGALLSQQPDADRIQQWERDLPVSVTTNPEVWFVRGTLARQRQDLRTAVRCFAEAVRSEPNYQAANFQLAGTLQALGEAQRAQPFLERARLLEELVVAVKMWQISQTQQPPIERAVKLTTELGLKWEAWGWQRLLNASRPASISPAPPTLPAIDTTTNLETVLQAYRAARQSDTFASIASLDFTQYPLPKSNTPAASQKPLSESAKAGPEIHFDNDASPAGLNVTYVNGSRPETAGEHMYEATGGGVGVLDYDLDGWPDLHFTQGSNWPPPSAPQASEQSPHLDRLYRNVQGERFADVTLNARLIEDRFSQGIAVGDLDNDGFSEVYVANIEGNRLFHNNGDGTFTDISEATGVAGSAWSTSCAIADFNGDSWPDIYVVNYVQGEGMFDRPCLLPDGQVRLCTPYEFDATDDRIYQNLGDGRFRDVTSEAGILVPDGKGLGVVAADFNNSGKISLFVANDTVPNFFFQNQTPQPGAIPRFEEQGFTMGVAVDAAGQSQACMGVACGDANGDGLLDMFVTNFHLESNTLYLQQPGSIFTDSTRSSGLYQPSFAQLGFGTQFVDADLDGDLDLIVTNGHVGDLSHAGVPYQMPTQVFRNNGKAQFDELPASQLGPFFQLKHLGRGMARLDWNRDGMDDVAISHLEEPVALLTNRTQTANRFLTLRLRGVTSSRDAVGATVTVTCGTRTMLGQLTAGDGFHASNERQLTFGLNLHDRVDQVSIRWPSGSVQTFRDLPSNAALLVIENTAVPIPFMPPQGE
ncbi:MAG: tetratricopeptide repeat protein [Planctomycetaceae bacterium]|nr:tetratricopeptide repeat protein [Planctomycetaceae bacterium]